MRLLVLLTICAGIANASLAAGDALFVELADSSVSSLAMGVSADGTTVVGSDSNEAARWNDGVLTRLGALLYTPSGAHDTSASGEVVVGLSRSPNGFWEAFRWEAGYMVGLGDLPGGDFSSVAQAVSADGSVIVGFGSSPTGYEAFRWTAESGMEGLGFLPGGVESSAYDVSADGSRIVGQVRYLTTGEAFVWEDGVMTGLGDLPGGANLSAAHGISADGRVIVGESFSATGRPEAFRWEEGAMVGLGGLPGGLVRSRALAVSEDGSTVVGWAETDLPQEAFIWNGKDGMRRLQDVLEELGLDLGDWTLLAANDVTPDGRTIVGVGRNPQSHFGAWMAVLPAPVIPASIDIKPGSDTNRICPTSRRLIPVALLGSDTFDVADVDVTTLAFGPEAAEPAFDLTDPLVYWLSRWDVNGDGHEDLLSHYRSNETGIAMGDTEACLTGETLDWDPFEGCDTVTTMPPSGCGAGAELALLLPPLMWLHGRRRQRRLA